MVERMKEDIRKLEEANQWSRKLAWLPMLVGIACLFAAFILLIVVLWHIGVRELLIVILFGIGAMCFAANAHFKAARRDRKDNIDELQFEIDLNDHAGTSVMEMKHLRINDLRLKRYYEQNLGQSNRIFYLGIVCICLGIGVVGVTFYLVKISDSENAQVVTGAIGGIGTLMTNFVAAIYLKMHGSIAENLGKFHAKLVDTHRVFLAFLAASRIEVKEKREETLSQLAIHLSCVPSDEGKETSPGDSSGKASKDSGRA